jgi:hypothetical protein
MEQPFSSFLELYFALDFFLFIRIIWEYQIGFHIRQAESTLNW